MKSGDRFVLFFSACRKGKLRGGWASDSGAVLVETAVLLPLLLLLFLGFADFARVFRFAIIVQNAATAGAAQASYSPTPAAMVAAAESAGSDILPFDGVNAQIVYECPDGTVVTASLTCPGYGPPWAIAEVTVWKQFKPFTHTRVLPPFSPMIVRTAKIRTQ